MSNRTLRAHAHLVIPMPPLRVAVRRPGSGLGRLQEFSLVGGLSLCGFWALAEIAFFLLG
jgi:hypothetical protein